MYSNPPALTLGTAAPFYTQARNFVRSRLRFVNAAQSGWAPILAGAGAMAIASPVAAILPLIGAGTAVAFGVSVGFGVLNGQRDIRQSLGSGF